MQSTPVEAPAQADFGSITTVITVENERYFKLLRLRAIKVQLRELRAEHDRLQAELFGQVAS